jgi:hypothetical protein
LQKVLPSQQLLVHSKPLLLTAPSRICTLAGEQRGLEELLTTLPNTQPAVRQRCHLPNKVLVPTIIPHLPPLRAAAAARLPGTVWDSWAGHLRPIDTSLDTAGLLLEEVKGPLLGLSLMVRQAGLGRMECMQLSLAAQATHWKDSNASIRNESTSTTLSPPLQACAAFKDPAATVAAHNAVARLLNAEVRHQSSRLGAAATVYFDFPSMCLDYGAKMDAVLARDGAAGAAVKNGTCALLRAAGANVVSMSELVRALPRLALGECPPTLQLFCGLRAALLHDLGAAHVAETRYSSLTLIRAVCRNGSAHPWPPRHGGPFGCLRGRPAQRVWRGKRPGALHVPQAAGLRVRSRLGGARPDPPGKHGFGLRPEGRGRGWLFGRGDAGVL